ncbi:MAG: type II toxin-antitoxin system RelE/ParE family toxin [Nitrospirae bacterium]|nr:type II toxin-antitoxin system RelE/ParE family toxin [Nitrospirota bacterium]
MIYYEIEWKPSAEQDLKSIDKQYIVKIIHSISNLANNPFPPQYRKLRDVENTYRIRIGVYRVIYQIDLRNKNIVVCRIRHRKNAY